MKQKDFSIAVNCFYIVVSRLIVFALAMLVLYLPELREIDFKIIHFVQGTLSAFPVYVAKFISSYGSSDCWLWPRITAAAVMVSHKNYLKAFLFLILTRLIYMFNDELIKPLVCRERPCGIMHAGYSFPSGHVVFSMTMFGILIYLVHRYVRTDWWRILLITLFSLWIVLVCIARMWLNVHFFTDVVAGLLVGFAAVNLYIILDKFFTR